jgi:hypothetical protein
MAKTTKFSLIMLLFVSLFAQGQTAWGPWAMAGDGSLQVRFARVNETTMTWAIKNNTTCQIKSFNFEYTFTDADTNQYTQLHDTVPLNLKPGESVGGWTAYTANTRGAISLVLPLTSCK